MHIFFYSFFLLTKGIIPHTLYISPEKNKKRTKLQLHPRSTPRRNRGTPAHGLGIEGRLRRGVARGRRPVRGGVEAGEPVAVQSAGALQREGPDEAGFSAG